MSDERKPRREPIVVVVGCCAFASLAIAALPFIFRGSVDAWPWAAASAAPSMMGAAIGAAYYLTRPRSGQQPGQAGR